MIVDRHALPLEEPLAPARLRRRGLLARLLRRMALRFVAARRRRRARRITDAEIEERGALRFDLRLANKP